MEERESEREGDRERERERISQTVKSTQYSSTVILYNTMAVLFSKKLMQTGRWFGCNF